jgi:hypothetical protein
MAAGADHVATLRFFLLEYKGGELLASEGAKALRIACWFQRVNSVRMLLEAGVPPFGADGRDHTALKYALHTGTPDCECVRALLEHAVPRADAEHLSAAATS